MATRRDDGLRQEPEPNTLVTTRRLQTVHRARRWNIRQPATEGLKRSGWVPRQFRQHDQPGEGLPNGVVGSREAGVSTYSGIWATEVLLSRVEGSLRRNLKCKLPTRSLGSK